MIELWEDEYMHKSRKWLNKDETLPAYIISHATIYMPYKYARFENEKDHRHGDYELILSDCHRRITLSFEMDTVD